MLIFFKKTKKLLYGYKVYILSGTAIFLAILKATGNLTENDYQMFIDLLLPFGLMAGRAALNKVGK